MFRKDCITSYIFGIGYVLQSAIHNANPNASILSVVPGYSGAFVPKICLSTLPSLMSSYFSAENMLLLFSSLTVQCDLVFDSLSVTSEQAPNLEMKTRVQTKSKLWRQSYSLHLQTSFSIRFI